MRIALLRLTVVAAQISAAVALLGPAQSAASTASHPQPSRGAPVP